MAENMGLRERKKQRTRQVLIDAAVRLFEENGYEKTTVADIAAAADVASRTFFLHFPAKEDVLFATVEDRVGAGVETIAERRPDETPQELLARSMREMIERSFADDLSNGLAQVRARLVVSTPNLLARQLHKLSEAQSLLAEELRRVYPQELDAIAAAALTGSLTGAVSAAALASLARGDGAENVRAAMLRAVEIVLGSASTARGGR